VFRNNISCNDGSCNTQYVVPGKFFHCERDNLEAYNNTFYNTIACSYRILFARFGSPPAVPLNPHAASSCSFRNNIFYGPGMAIDAEATATGNLFDNNSYFGGLSHPTDAHAKTSDPMFVDRNAGPAGLKLQPNSSCIDAGLLLANSGGRDFCGTQLYAGPADIGAFENVGQFAFAYGNFDRLGKPDLWAIKRWKTGSGKTEAHILSGAQDSYSSFLTETGTAEGETNADCEFYAADFDHNGIGDLYMVKKRNTGSRMTEVHVLDGADNFQSYLSHSATAFGETDSTFAFAVADYNSDSVPDLWVIRKRNGGTGSTEIQILNGANGFSTYLLTTRGTAEPPTDGRYEFGCGDYNRDGKPDLFLIKKSGCDTHSTEVHVLDGANQFQSYLLHTGTPMSETDNSFSFCVGDYNSDGFVDVICVRKWNTGTGMTEVHILNGNGNYQTLPVETGTALVQTN